ncbi:hypothetical protein GCM10027049_30350 [Mucilaginibacter puniceus]
MKNITYRFMKIYLILLLACSTYLVKAQNSMLATTDVPGVIVPKLPGKKPVTVAIGDTVTVYKYYSKSNLWDAKYKGTLGAIDDEMLKLQDNLTRFKKTFIHKEFKADMIKKYGVKYGTQIANGEVSIGMTRKMFDEVYGKPTTVNRSVGAWGVHEQLVYEDTDGKSEYFYFENGKLTSWQD